MKEYIIAFDGAWRHFFIKPHVGLCWRKKDGFKFSDYEVILKGACSDFCVYTDGSSISVACQDESGSVLYLLYDKASWKKTILLESRSAEPYIKSFAFIKLSGYMNLLYTVKNKEKEMLVHQLIIENSTPFVVDYISKSIVPFCIVPHEETNFTIFYVDSKGISGYKLYRWSEKAYSDFKKLADGSYSIKFAKMLKNGKIMASATKADEKTITLASLLLNENKDISENISIYQDCTDTIVPIISEYAEKMHIVWTEYGNVVASHLKPDGNWQSPVRYAGSSSRGAVLYVVCIKGNYKYFYGIPREHDIILYGTHDFLKAPPEESKKATGSAYSESENYTEEIIKKQTEQIKKLYEELSHQRNKLSELSIKLEEIISTVPIADEEAIDKVLMN